LPPTTNLNCESSLSIVSCDTAPNGLVPSSSTATDPFLEIIPPLDPTTHPTMIPTETSPTFFLAGTLGSSEAAHAATAEGGGFDDGERGGAQPAGRLMSDDDGGMPFSMPSSTTDDALGIDW